MALLFFNIGVEIGKLLFIAAILSVISLAHWLVRRTAIPQPLCAWRRIPSEVSQLFGWFNASPHFEMKNRVLTIAAVGEALTRLVLFVYPPIVIKYCSARKSLAPGS